MRSLRLRELARHPNAVNVLAALAGVGLFLAVSAASGKIDVVNGLGWDGFIYGRMVSGTLADGSSNARLRPVPVLIARIPYALGVDVVSSFFIVNVACAFALYLTAGSLLQRCGVAPIARSIVVASLALCVATSKTFGFYPVQIELAALVFSTLAVYLAVANRPWLCGAACVLATTSRELGLAAPLFAMHRGIRERRPTRELLAYVPSIAAMILVRWWSASQPSGGDPHSLTVAVDNLRLWSSPAFVGAFAYFSVTLFGGISALLAVRARWCASRLREQPEMVTYLVVVVGAAVVGNLDIWRYLAYALPIALLLVGQYLEGDDGAAIRRTLAAVLLFTVVTQRPFQAMDAEQYLRDWFPLYPYFGAQPAAAGLTALWIARAASVVLLMVALHAMVRRRPPAHGAAIMTPGVLRSA